MLIDTSGLFCYFDNLAAMHDDATDFFYSAVKRLTHSYVLAEFIALADARGLDRSESLKFSHELLNNPLVEVVFVDKSLHLRALNFLRHRLDKSWSLCDAVSFTLMEDRNVTDALTTDHHFEQAGFVRLLEP